MRAAVLVLALLSLGDAATASVPSGKEVARRLVDDVLAPIVTRLEEAGTAGITLRATDFADEDLESAVAGFFLARGFEVYVLQDDDPLPAGDVVTLDLSDVQAAVAYPRVDDGAWGFGSRRLLRQASLSVSGKLEDPRSGRRLWQGTPEARYEDWIRESEKDLLSADSPVWLRENQGAGLGKTSAAWKEKAVVLGLLGGVIVLYFSGAD